MTDCDLNTNQQTAETVQVNVASTSDPVGRTVVLTERTPTAAAFAGSVPLSTTADPNALLVADGDTVTVTYIDANDGLGGNNIVVTKTAVADCAPPVISEVQATNVQAKYGTVSFATGEPAIGTIYYGLDCADLNETASEIGLRTFHSFDLKQVGQGHDLLLHRRGRGPDRQP